MEHQLSAEDHFQVRQLASQILQDAPVWSRLTQEKRLDYVSSQFASEIGRRARSGDAWALRVRDYFMELKTPSMLRDFRLHELERQAQRELTAEEQAAVMGILLLGGTEADAEEMLRQRPAH